MFSSFFRRKAIKFAQLQRAQLKQVHVLEDLRDFDVENFINYAELLKSVKDNTQKMFDDFTTYA